MPDQKPTIFISYSHKDTEWKDRLLRHLNTLKKRAATDPWSDDQINPGDDWYDQINAAMQRASVAVCLISADFLTSDFCQQEEIPYLLERRENDGLLLIPVLLRPCLWDEYPWLKAIQMHPKEGKSVARDYDDDWETVFVALTTQIRDFLTNRKKPTPPPPAWTAITNDDVSIERLPRTGMELFGRRKEINLLNSAWNAAQTNVVSFVAYGGVGKSTLVNKWLSQMEADNWRGGGQKCVRLVVLQSGHRRAGHLCRPVHRPGVAMVWG